MPMKCAPCGRATDVARAADRTEWRGAMDWVPRPGVQGQHGACTRMVAIGPALRPILGFLPGLDRPGTKFMNLPCHTMPNRDISTSTVPVAVVEFCGQCGAAKTNLPVTNERGNLKCTRKSGPGWTPPPRAAQHREGKPLLARGQMLRVARGSLRARLRQPLATASGTGTALHPFKLCQAPPPCASIARLATSGAAETASDISSAKKAAKDRRFARKASPSPRPLHCGNWSHSARHANVQSKFVHRTARTCTVTEAPALGLPVAVQCSSKAWASGSASASASTATGG